MTNNGSDPFYKAGDAIDLLKTPPRHEGPVALERLGPAPFRRKGFPLLGFLASVYEHVSSHVKGGPVNHEHTND